MVTDKEKKSSIKNTWKELKETFLHYKRIVGKKYSLSDYLDELSPYSDLIIAELETDELKYERGYCNFECKEDKIILSFVFFFKNYLINDIEVKEMKRYLNRNIFNNQAIKELELGSKTFEIIK